MKDLTKPFFETYEEGDFIIVESNLPNNTAGDQAFEWDFDGSQRKKWEEYMEELKKNGTYGDLVYTTMRVQKNNVLDIDTKDYDPPLSSFKFMMIDANDLKG